MGGYAFIEDERHRLRQSIISALFDQQDDGRRLPPSC